MYEFKVTWNEDDEDFLTYSFPTKAEALAFQLAVREASFHGRDLISMEIKETLDSEIACICAMETIIKSGCQCVGV